MIEYLYDGSFPGLLTAVYQTLAEKNTDWNICRASEFQPDLFSQTQIVVINNDWVGKLVASLACKLSKPALLDIYYCFLSEERGIEKLISVFISKATQYPGTQFEKNCGDKTVLEIQKISSRVSYEIHRFQGFVRFRQMKDGIYYAPVEPNYNIISLLAPHFTARFADQQWLIHDLRRGKGIFYDGDKCSPVRLSEIQPEALRRCPPVLSGMENSVFAAAEPELQHLWNDYFQAVAIPERHNKKLQRQHMPSRYWKHLVEQVEE